MSKDQSQQKSLESAWTPSDGGTNRERLKQLDSAREEQDGTILKTSKKDMLTSLSIRKRRRKTHLKNISTVESLRRNRKLILKDKSATSKNDTQIMKSSRKLQAESISKGKASKGFWTSVCRDLSRKLWLPTEIASAGSHGTTSDGSLSAVESVSWSRTTRSLIRRENSQTTSWPSSMFSLVGTTVAGGDVLDNTLKDARLETLQKRETMRMARLTKQGKNPTMKEINVDDNYFPSAKVVRIRPSYKQIHRINDFVAATRKTFDLSLHETKSTKEFPKEKILRDKFVIRKNMSKQNVKKYEWLFRTPKRIREYAVKDLIASYKSGITQIKLGLIKHFNVKPKNRKDLDQTICIPHEGSHLYREKKTIKFCGMEMPIDELPDCETLNHNMRLLRRGNAYFLAIPIFSTPKKRKCERNNRMVAIDPGIKIFGTYFSPEEWGKLGDNVEEKVDFYRKKMESIKKKFPNRVRLLSKVHLRLTNLINDFHWKACHWLLENFDRIVIPRLYVSRSSKNVKENQKYMKHCKFVDRLIHKSVEYEGREIHVVHERYTTMTCGRCGCLRKPNGRVYKCWNCDLVIHRDLNGARNILLKHLSIVPS